MKYLSENNQEISAMTDDVVSHKLFEFDLKQKDYFLRFKNNWDIIKCPAYEFVLDNSVYCLPYYHHILIGDDVGEVDFVRIDEMFGRGITVPYFDVDLKRWNIDEPILVNYHQEKEFYSPLTKNILPVVDRGSIVMIAEKDLYNYIKRNNINQFVSVV